MDDKIKVLFLAANPIDAVRLCLEEEIREIDIELQKAQFRDSFELIPKFALRPKDLQDSLLRNNPNIVHFSGHGSKHEEIILQDDSGNSKPLSKGALSGLFSVLRENIRLVILNACHSKPQAEAIAQIVDCTIGMNKTIGDEAAIVFASSFYRALGYGLSIKDAFELGKNAIMLEGIPEEKTPVLIERDGVNAAEIFLIKQTARTSNIHLEKSRSDLLDSISKMSLPELLELILDKLTRAEIGKLWFVTLEEDMNDAMHGKESAECVIGLLDRARKRERLPRLRKELRKMIHNPPKGPVFRVIGMLILSVILIALSLILYYSPSASEPITEATIAVMSGASGEPFNNDLVVRVIEIYSDNPVARYRVTATVTSPGYPDLPIQKEGAGYTVDYKGKENYVITILEVKEFLARFKITKKH